VNDYSEIQQTLTRLSPSDRMQISLWLYELREGESRTLRVCEPGRHDPRGIMSVEEYLEFESRSPVRHEYVAGSVYAMSSVSRLHSAIQIRVLTAIEDHLRGRATCESHASDVKLRLKSAGKEHFYYPDLMVVCDPQRLEPPDAEYIRYPRLIVEVTSPSTESIDRREKLLMYKHIETLEEYVVIAQEECEVTICRRAQDWRPIVLNRLDERAEFRSLQLTLPVSQIYRDVE
jgi:Uma2 family endonuclease